MVADVRAKTGRTPPSRRTRSSGDKNGVTNMLDAFYVVVGCLFLLGCWAFTKACDRL